MVSGFYANERRDKMMRLKFDYGTIMSYSNPSKRTTSSCIAVFSNKKPKSIIVKIKNVLICILTFTISYFVGSNNSKKAVTSYIKHLSYITQIYKLFPKIISPKNFSKYVKALFDD